MTARSKQSLRERTAHIAAVLIFALGQLVATTHAEVDHLNHGEHGDHIHYGDHDGHGDRDPIESGAHCAICCLTASDDDVHASTIACELHVDRTPERNDLIPALQFIAARSEASSLVRGPPHN